MEDKILENIKKRLDCLILLNCMDDSSKKEKLNIASNCIGMAETARLLGKDLSNFSKYLKCGGKNGK